MANAPDQLFYQGARYIRADLYAPQKGDADITADNLLESFMDLEPAVAADLAAKLMDINKASQGGSNIPTSVALRLLNAANDTIQGFGVEVIRPPEGRTDDTMSYDDVLAEYVNTGDTYNATILWDSAEQMFYLTTWGDWYEAWEYAYDQEHGRPEEQQ
jgi:hypothetical protein